MNSVNLTGRLTKDPDPPFETASGNKVVDLRLAVNHHKRDTVYVDVKCWGGTAEAAHEYLTKGSLVGVTGELARDEWTDKQTGEPRQRYYVNARAIDFLGPRLDQAAAGASTEPAGVESA
ncbi:MAG TPA: single-stranded DNA-binding protein [Acidimicrobiales bacterium]|jgi:single-strand DNA-binding protein|nr:single-stranded DNA-binding protein [Acidimicrobiales bacterium]